MLHMSEKDVGQRLRELRKDFGFSQEHLARELDVTVSTVIKWERGDFYPGAKSLLVLIERFGVSMNWLLAGRGPKFAK